MQLYTPCILAIFESSAPTTKNVCQTLVKTLVTHKMADLGRSNFCVVFTMIVCGLYEVI